jgi:peptide/nickel transport system substrate-binding protein
MFFFEKKNQKTFASCRVFLWRVRDSAMNGFLRLFSKKAVLAFLLANAPLHATEHRGGVLHFASYQADGTIDPQISYETDIWQILYVTQDQLLDFRKAEGHDGAQVVPDLAEALPEIRDGGRTYVFRLRKGVHFSTGRTVEVEDVVASFRRMFRVSGPNVGSWYGIIVGADACLKKPDTCMLEGGVEADPAGRTITLHLTRPDAEFAQKIALPFASVLPADTPAHDLGTTPPAATGPYMIQSYDPLRGMVLVRNPYFHEWSTEAQPDGHADRIEIRYGLQAESEVSAIENGSLDWMSDPPPLDRLAEIGGRYPALAHIDALTAYYFLEMNTHQPPFDDVRARQAVALAVNRRVVVNLFGGPALGSPLCHLLPNGLAGSEPYCPYAKTPGPTWDAPDLARARALVKASGTAGMRVTLIASDRDVEHSMGIYLQSVLQDIGYDARLHSISFNIRDSYMENTSNHVQIGLTNWFQDYPAPSDFLNVLFSCASFHPGSDASINMSGFCDPGIDARMQAAMAAELSDPAGAARQWAAIDHDLTDRAPYAALFQIHWLDLTSSHFGNFTFSPLFHMIFSKAWVQ